MVIPIGGYHIYYDEKQPSSTPEVGALPFCASPERFYRETDEADEADEEWGDGELERAEQRGRQLNGEHELAVGGFGE